MHDPEVHLYEPAEVLIGRTAAVVAAFVAATLHVALAQDRIPVVTTTADLKSLVEAVGADRVEVESQVEGVPRHTERDCTYHASDFEVTVTFVGGGGLELEYGFADFSPDRLVLDGFEYQRLA